MLLDHFGDMALEYIEPEPLDEEFPVNFDVLELMESGAAFINHKILPRAGGWMDQPRWWINAMQQVYLPGINRAKFERLPPEERQLYRKRPKKRDIPPDGEW